MQNIKELKKTNIPWMGEIPKHWEVRRLKSLYDFDKGQGLSKLDISNEGIHECLLYGELFTRFKGYNVIDDNFQKTNIQERKISKGNELLIPGSTTTTSVDLCNCKALKKSRILLGGDIIILRPLKKKTLNEFYSYFISSICKTEFVMYGRGVTIHHIYPNQIGNMKVLLPPLSEQKAIANYLDRQNKKINHFIEKRQRFIELLKEQRQTIIENAVSSNNDNWELKRLKFISDLRFSNVDKHTVEYEKIVRLCNYMDVYKNDYILDSMDLMIASASDSEIEKFQVLKGDIIITKDSETPEDIAVPTYVKEYLDNVVCGYHLALIRADESQILGEYLFRVFQSKKVNSHFRIRATGVIRVGLSLDDISGVNIPFPKSLKEQHQIASYIKTETTKIDQAIEKSEREILLIKEYKESMIAEAVLGKLVVSG